MESGREHLAGARTTAQLEDNLGALEVDFTVSPLARLDEASATGFGFPHDMPASDHIRKVTAGDLKIETRRRYRYPIEPRARRQPPPSGRSPHGPGTVECMDLGCG